MDLKYNITKITGSIASYGMKEDIGEKKVVHYELLLNDKKIGDFTYNKEDIPEKELLKQFIETHILKNEYELKRVMKFLGQNVPDEEFFTELCEDDFYEGIKHDLRNPEIISNFQVREYGRDLNFTYLSFLKKHQNLLNKYYRG